MARYAARLQRTSSTTLSVGSLAADAVTPRRQKIYDLIFGQESNPSTSNQVKWQLQRFTAAGTSTAVTPQPLDPADAAALADVGENHTVDPTYTASQFLLDVGMNSLATVRWVAAPGSELVIPATASNGIGIATPTAPTPAILLVCTMMFEEQ